MKKNRGAVIGMVAFAIFLIVLLVGPTRLREAFGGSVHDWSRPLVHRDLDAIARDTLRVLVLRDPLTWDVHGKEQTGLEWELMERFAHKASLTLKHIEAKDPAEMLRLLQTGVGDVMVAQLTPSGSMRGSVSFSSPYRMVAPLRIALKGDALMRSGGKKRSAPNNQQPITNYQLRDTLFMSRWSPFFGVIDPKDTTFNDVVLQVDSASPEELMMNVALGLHRAALCTDASGEEASKRLPQVRFGPRMGRSVPLAFAVRINSPSLLEAINAWIRDDKEARQALITSYANGPLNKATLRGMRTIDLDGDGISPYDSLFQISATSLDWKLLAAVAFKESRFDTSAVNSSGASGLMQMMPGTAASMGVHDTSSVDDHIHGAARYLAELDTIWRGSIPNVDQRLKFVLASYNAGPGHIKDAQRLAEHFGLDTRRWDGNVERAVTLLAIPRYVEMDCVKNGYLRGSETFWYVRDVIAAFAQFRKAGTK